MLKKIYVKIPFFYFFKKNYTTSGVGESQSKLLLTFRPRLFSRK
jgi:hypothetical protein